MAKVKRSKRPDARPARGRYWRDGKLERHKVRNMVRDALKTERAAYLHANPGARWDRTTVDVVTLRHRLRLAWEAARQRRVKH